MQLENAETIPKHRRRKSSVVRIAPDGRTRGAKRQREIVADLTAMLGRVPDAGEVLLIQNAAVLTLALEGLGRAQLRGEAVNGERLLKLSGQLNRTVAGLRRSTARRPPQTGPSLDDLIARHKQKAATG